MAMASNPRARVVELSGMVHDIDRKARRCVSYAAMSDQEHFVKELQMAVTKYNDYLASMRIVAHPSQKEV
ncbi:hypothetical protein D1872_307870 [compost metagenome]